MPIAIGSSNDLFKGIEVEGRRIAEGEARRMRNGGDPESPAILGGPASGVSAARSLLGERPG
jgi:hypothetical protein